MTEIEETKQEIEDTVRTELVFSVEILDHYKKIIFPPFA
jgi:hypothetical protein